MNDARVWSGACLTKSGGRKKAKSFLRLRDYVLSVFFNQSHPPSQRSGLNAFSEGLLNRGEKKSSFFRHSRVGIESPWRTGGGEGVVVAFDAAAS